ncbi:transcription repressor NadR [Alteribacter natronophilus]|uniref:transcription repressor NadR n=1 Tax=Alteribacter natronophilus TaxID=2583810 RepID=UPI00110E1CA2|nr:transcription repressor NadR [Alteribacter natronophilus]TMW70272.1 transcription repressor NadR [Alteribacter natronophilus]
MNDSEKKWRGEERREKINALLRETSPLTGTELGKKLNVSRQVIVQDVSLLKARGIPVMATSEGYVLVPNHGRQHSGAERVIACRHKPDEAKKELFLLVDHGITVRDVKIEHPVYGDLTASIMVRNRKEVERFIERIEQEKAAYLSELTDGVHLHTIEGSSEDMLDEGVAAIREAGFLVEDS